MDTTTGPRRLVFNNLANPPNRSRTDTTTVQPGKVRSHSTSTPQLVADTVYTANVTQTIKYPDPSNGQTQTVTLNSQQKFQLAGSPWRLDPSAIHSVYPPAGHSDSAGVLPHVLFDNLQFPWTIEATNPKTVGLNPWLGLIVFTDDDLALSVDQRSALGSLLPSMTPSPTLAYSMTPKKLLSLGTRVTTQFPSEPLYTNDDDTALQVIFLKGALFDSLFKLSNVTTLPNKPHLDRFRYMTHIRTVNTQGMANHGGANVESYSVAVSPRCGPLNVTKPTTMHAHLVSFHGVWDNMSVPTPQPPANPPTNVVGPLGLASLVSLYSWSYTCLPDDSLAVSAAFTALGKTIQPMRCTDSLLTQPKLPASTTDDWVRNRMLTGYNLTRHRLPTGEVTLGFYRSVLTPLPSAKIDFAPSDYGIDLAIINRNAGYAELTFQLAWELGRTLAISDRTFGSALARLRSTIHSQALAAAKSEIVTTYKSNSEVISTLPATMETMGFVCKTTWTSSMTTGRWLKTEGAVGTRAGTTILGQQVQNKYVAQVHDCCANLAMAMPALGKQTRSTTNPTELYNELNSALSTDYAGVLSWCMDKWFLFGIPMANLIPDPAFVPKESIRTFYVDQNWFKVFIDGALSISHHYNEKDDIREAIKASLTTYLTTNLPNGYPPQIPQWGFFLRSELVSKFPDMRISAPRESDTRSEILRMERIDTDTLLVLFDRVPGDFSDGITIHPPQHQMSFGVDDVNLADKTWNVLWKPVCKDLTVNEDTFSSYIQPTLYHLDIATPILDLSTSLLDPAIFANGAEQGLAVGSNPFKNRPSVSAALVGTQLTRTVPTLTLQVPLGNTPRSLGTTGSLTGLGRDTKFNGPNNNWGIPPIVGGGSENDPFHITPTPPTLYGSLLIGATAKVDLSINSKVREEIMLIALFFPPRTGPAPNPVANTNVGGFNDLKPQMQLTAYNLQTRTLNTSSNAYEVRRAAVSFNPTTLGFTSDLYISLVSLASQSGQWFLRGVDITFTVGNTNDCILKSFPQNSGVSAPTINPAGDYTHQPNFTGILLPKVRSTGSSRRWLVQTAYAPGSSNTFTVTLTPNVSKSTDGTGQDSWDIGVVRDLSFVIEKVQLGWGGNDWTKNPSPYQSLFPIDVVERYVRFPSSAGTTGIAKGRSTVSVMAVQIARRLDL